MKSSFRHYADLVLSLALSPIGTGMAQSVSPEAPVSGDLEISPDTINKCFDKIDPDNMDIHAQVNNIDCGREVLGVPNSNTKISTCNISANFPINSTHFPNNYEDIWVHKTISGPPFGADSQVTYHNTTLVIKNGEVKAFANDRMDNTPVPYVPSKRSETLINLRKALEQRCFSKSYPLRKLANFTFDKV